MLSTRSPLMAAADIVTLIAIAAVAVLLIVFLVRRILTVRQEEGPRVSGTSARASSVVGGSRSDRRSGSDGGNGSWGFSGSVGGGDCGGGDAGGGGGGGGGCD